MKKILAFISILLFLILLWYTRDVYNECCNNNKVVEKEKTEEVIVVTNEPLDPLTFLANSGIATTNEGWKELKNQILSARSEEKILQITAPYLKNETEKIGIERAKSAFMKLEIDLDTAKIEYKAYLLEVPNEEKPFSGAKFNWLTRNNNIEELEDKALMYFPNNSTKKINNRNISDYLKNVVQQIKGTDKKVYLSGHTDNVGDSEKNKKLSLKRANSVKSELLVLGLDENQIIVIGYGEEQPIADNSTPKGRQKNRRVELQIK
jgi:outer membrane protein OmpA-like peptidoglycan-associated protein